MIIKDLNEQDIIKDKKISSLFSNRWFASVFGVFGPECMVTIGDSSPMFPWGCQLGVEVREGSQKSQSMSLFLSNYDRVIWIEDILQGAKIFYRDTRCRR